MKAELVLGPSPREGVPGGSSLDVLDEAVQIASGTNPQPPTRAHLICLALQNDILREEVTTLRRALLLRGLEEEELEELDAVKSYIPKDWVN